MGKDPHQVSLVWNVSARPRGTSYNDDSTSKSIPVMTPSLPSHDVEWNDSWPAPLSRKIDVWIWSSLLLSLVLLPALQLNNNTGSSIIPCVLVSMFYNATLLILSRKERKIAGFTEMFTIGDNTTRRHSKLRSKMTFWVLAVCQIYLALLGLYVPARLTFLLWMPSGKLHGSLPVYIELLFAVGQMVVMGYISGCCILHDEEISEYVKMQAKAWGGDRGVERKELDIGPVKT
ncbi:hypothetical protein M413DRAFT_27394 [Hebeloma cylindrosporum]|uniref:Uncharacterized protein n=1 Tax=Hebeloma cylindrosporum TaxID=76867 RepID=A0A0C3CC53_HEBCY|nr:hypothetical protein M413DRAFT_27394 [Hebeloma cylindrosporum h7]